MSMKKTVQKQYQARIDRAACADARALDKPSEGWIATMRKALGMSGPQLAAKMGQTRANIYKTERAERDEGASLKSVRAAAAAMNCKLVYAIIPHDGSAADMVEVQARKKAQAIVQSASTHMALEKQSLSAAQQDAEVERLTQELISEMPADLWNDA